MRKLIKKFLWAVALIITLPSAWAFSLSGPIGNADDSWQIILLAYGYNDPVAPKDIFEEYRPVVPVQYYASDASFISYYGTSGLTNIDAAFGMLNGVMSGQTNTPVFLSSPTNGITMDAYGQPGGTPLTLGVSNSLDSYSSDLSEFPFESQQQNYTAQTLGLFDMKSTVLHEMVLELGLANPERYVWTLHDREFTPGLKNPKCPKDEEYLVVQRNFDITQDYPYSSYINNSLYTFYIAENCGNGGVPYSAITRPVPADPFNQNLAVAAGGLLTGNFGGFGGFYTGLTRDDVMGLKYLLSTNNVNWEATAPSGSLLLITNVQAQQTLTTLPISLLLNQATTNDPGTLLTNYPGITFLSVTTNIVTQIAPVTSAYFTNLPPPYTNTVPLSNGVSIYAVGGTVPFPWSPIQYGTYPNYPTLVTTLPLRALLLAAQFLDPVALQTLYPGLLVGSVKTNFFTVLNTTNPVPYFTNQSVLPVYTNYVKGGLTNGFYFTNQPGPTTINYDITQPFTVISTLDLANFSDLAHTSSPAIMQTLYPGLQILRATTFPSFVPVTNYVHYLTNKTGAPYQGAPIAVTKAVSTNYVWITNWNYTFGNVLTNHYYTNRIVRVQSIWVKSPAGAPYGTLVTTTNNVTYKTNLVSGDFFIIPTNWCGFEVAGTLPLGNPPYSYGLTNAIFYNGYNTNGATGTNIVAGGNSYGLVQYVYDLYTNRNYAVYPGICEPVVQWGTNYTTNIVTTYSYDFLNVVTNHYYTNSLVSVFVTNVFSIPGGSPDLLATNVYTTNYYANLPDGDFYLVPTNWCGYQIISLQTNFVTPTILLTNTASGTSNLQYTYVAYLSYTNYTYSIRPGFCEPYLAITTNFSTNIITQYSYYFGNIITNSYYTNSPVTVVTTNLAILTNGLVGMLTNIVTTNITYNGISGDFYIPPANWCDYSIVRTQLQSAVYFTNTLTATNLPGVPDLGQAYNQTTITVYTNTVLTVKPSICSQAAPVANLRRGIGRVQFIRANYDSLLGQFFQPLTNTYSMTVITNSQSVVEYYQRVVTQPDLLFKAQDLTVVTQLKPYGVDYTITTPNFDTSAIITGLAGPGTIIPGVTMVFNKNANDLYLNGSLAEYNYSTNGFLNLDTQTTLGAFGSFDGSTNYPVIYPSGASVTSVMNQMIIQVTPSAAPDATNGTPYSVTFSATGGQPPYVWVAPNISTLVPGLSFNATTATVSGTPAAPGIFTFTLQLTDSANRVINLNYPITIH